MIAKALYQKNSPWYKAIVNKLYLEKMEYRKPPVSSDDAPYTIENQYKHRPDLLAYDLYGDPKLWWIFVNRNRDILKDPIYDFVPGTLIYCPSKTTIIDFISE